ncbi:uracil-DNA glycosylase [Nocardia flavorosea]|uniref:uracil-DNA glycosylase n=1 Tax=Nocardia flavorosea TaxID=53429 RepID=UPI001893923F|nr:uracil-DNA glycosylase [Nocardia flavorosea]MBF6352880.1 uracil-DNA glycosylase [Nocardia flavorosea]
MLADKRSRLRQPHIAPLNRLADRIADAEAIPRGHAPYVDPDLGGVHARALVLLDNPSTKADAARTGGSGLLSLDNNDHTAKNCREAHAANGIEWSQVVHWNVWPFPTGRENGGSTAAERSRAVHWTREFVTLLPELEIVLCLGRAAEDGWKRTGIHRDDLYVFPFGVPHCSRRGLATPAARQRFEAAITQLARLLPSPRNSRPTA